MGDILLPLIPIEYVYIIKWDLPAARCRQLKNQTFKWDLPAARCRQLKNQTFNMSLFVDTLICIGAPEPHLQLNILAAGVSVFV